MIITVSMNPAIDKTVEIGSLIQGGLNRIRRVQSDVGGKGINVSRMIGELGGESIATGFLGGSAGRTVERVLCGRNIKTDFVIVNGETRTNTKIIEDNGAVTELNEPGPVICDDQLESLKKKLEDYAGPDILFVLAGSVPRGIDMEIYADIIRRVHEKGSRVLLDADGELFCRALSARPDVIKPNHIELAEYVGTDSVISVEQMAEQAAALRDNGIDTVAVSMGDKGAVFIGEGYAVRCPALSVEVHSTVGAGDAMVAALAYASERRMDPETMIRLCMAASAGAVTTEGTRPPSRQLVERLFGQVIIEPLK